MVLKTSPPSYFLKWRPILFYVIVAMLTITVNLYIAVMVSTLVSSTPTHQGYQHPNDIEFNDTLSITEEFKFAVNEKSKPHFWAPLPCTGMFLNLFWMYYSCAVYLDYYESKLSWARMLVMTALLHLLVMMLVITVFVIRLSRQNDSRSFTAAVICQSAVIMLVIMTYVFHIICLYETALRKQEKQNQNQLRHYLVKLKCEQVQDVIAAEV